MLSPAAGRSPKRRSGGPPTGSWFPPGRAAARPASPPRKRPGAVFHLPAAVRSVMQGEVEVRVRGVERAEQAHRRRIHTDRALGIRARRERAALGVMQLLQLHCDAFGCHLGVRACETRLRRALEQSFQNTAPKIRVIPPGSPPHPPTPRLPASSAAESDGAAELGSTQQRAVLKALEGSSGCCEQKSLENRQAPVGRTTEQMQALAQWLVAEWHQKKCSVVDELLANLKAPPAIQPSSALKLQVLSLAASHLHSTKGQHYAGVCMAELLCMLLYTMAGPDIDALMTFNDVPDYDSEKEKWSEYQTTKSPQRNGAIFSAINWALRTAGEPPPVPCPAGSDTPQYATLRGWVKYIVLLLALASKQGSGVGGGVVARGLAGLPAEVVKEHSELKRGAAFRWPAASSCAFDKAVSESYIRGDAANATKQSGGAILFLLRKTFWGMPLQNISKYPKEAELLLPPLTEFVVESVETVAKQSGYGVPAGTLLVTASCSSVLGNTMLRELCVVARRDAARASALLQRTADGLPTLTKRGVRSSTLRLHTTSSWLHCRVPDIPLESSGSLRQSLTSPPPPERVLRQTASSAAMRTCSPPVHVRPATSPAARNAASPRVSVARLRTQSPTVSAKRAADASEDSLSRLSRPTAATSARLLARRRDTERLRASA
eukprot:TRINITY_DN12257_c1_g2_i3.p1 TRINITY_DN12257_c1_g2~~TRINITY_DN12257_c1_g2_i3.p1  ORF type:complete len:681 (+),score=146.69 TRINITY_DN12257_c1_g2_i3:56-2044(+)